MGDITCIRTWEIFIYLATVLDSRTKKATRYVMASRMRTSLFCNAIDMAVRNHPHQERPDDIPLCRPPIRLRDLLQTPQAHGIIASADRT